MVVMMEEGSVGDMFALTFTYTVNRSLTSMSIIEITNLKLTLTFLVILWYFILVAGRN